MINLFFEHFGEHVVVEVNGKNVLFSNSKFGAIKSDISGLKLNYKGVVKEFPDLQGEDNWKALAIKKFKDKIDMMDNEKEIAQYIIEDLKKHGYIPLYKQIPGFRPNKI